MPNADYYREQARLLLRWAASATDQALAQRLSYRAHDMLQLADRTVATVSGREADDTLNAALLNAAGHKAYRVR